ncbi:MAG: GNAT family N-acetyltransferase [Ilumatobacteraceae bacterium]
MHTLRERHLAGLDYLESVTVLLQRIRCAHPTAGLYQAAVLQWWSRDLRSTDEFAQLFWFDDHDRPAAAVIATDWGDGSSSSAGSRILPSPGSTPSTSQSTGTVFWHRGGPLVEARLRQTSLYRPDLDLVVHDRHDDVAAYGLFWFDPETATGVVEPMRTEDDHQRRGLARHVLTSGIDLLAAAGAERISIGWEPDNPASGHLYRSVGLEPVLRTDVFSGPPRR